MSELARLISYDAEKTRARVWQDAALTALGALIAAHPPRMDQIESDRLEIYSKAMARAAFFIADEFEKQHGPSVSGYLQTEKPFAAAPGVKGDDADDDNDPDALVGGRY